MSATNRRRFAGIGAAIIVALLIAACGPDHSAPSPSANSASVSPTTEASSSESVASTTAAPAPTAAPPKGHQYTLADVRSPQTLIARDELQKFFVADYVQDYNPDKMCRGITAASARQSSCDFYIGGSFSFRADNIVRTDESCYDSLLAGLSQLHWTARATSKVMGDRSAVAVTPMTYVIVIGKGNMCLNVVGDLAIGEARLTNITDIMAGRLP